MLTIPSAVEDALKNGAQKNFRVHFPNGERADITNDNIVSESVSFTESICSQSELKFGLAEASVLEFETVGVENIRGVEIEASDEVEYGNGLTYSIPYGRFIVDECKRQTNLEHRKIVAYSRGAVGNEVFTSIENYRRNTPVSTNTPLEILALPSALMNLSIKGKFEAFNYLDCTDETTISVTFTQILPNCELEFSGVRNIWHGGFLYFEYGAPLYSTDELIHEVESITHNPDVLDALSENYNAFKDGICYFPKGNINIGKANLQLTSNSFYIDTSGIDSTSDAKTGILTAVYVNGTRFEIRSANSYKAFEASNSAYIFSYNKLYIPRKKASTGKYICEPVDYTMYEILVGCIETLGCFGRNKRDGGFDIISLNDNFASPDYTLTKSDYSQCWYEEAPTLPYGKVECFYKDLNGDDAHISKRIQNVNPCLVYDLTNNAFVKNTRFSSAQIQTLIDIFASNVTNISYIAADISAVGLPFLEAGDVIEVNVGNNETIKTFIEKRTISGVQALFDDISAEANEDYIGEWVEEEETALMLIENGLYQNGFSFVGKAYRSEINTSNGVTGTPTVTENYTGGVVRAYHSATASNGNRACSICSNAKIDLTEYSTLHIEYNYSTWHASTTNTYVAFVVPTSTMSSQGYAVSKSYEVCHITSQGEFSYNGIAEIDISSLTGEYYIGADITYRPGSSNGYTDMQIKNMWLE